MLLQPIKAGFRLARDGGDVVWEVRSHPFSPRPAFFFTGGGSAGGSAAAAQDARASFPGVRLRLRRAVV